MKKEFLSIETSGGLRIINKAAIVFVESAMYGSRITFNINDSRGNPQTIDSKLSYDTLVGLLVEGK